jgi:hypothetical protein
MFICHIVAVILYDLWRWCDFLFSHRVSTVIHTQPHSEISRATKGNTGILKVNTSFQSLCYHKWSLNTWIFKCISRLDDKGDRFSPSLLLMMVQVLQISQLWQSNRNPQKNNWGTRRQKVINKAQVDWIFKHMQHCMIFMNFSEWRVSSTLQTIINVTIHVTLMFRKKHAFYLLYNSVS